MNKTITALFPENTHVHEIFQAFTEQEVLEKKIEELRKDYMEKLNEEEDNLFRTMNIKRACDKQLQEVTKPC